MNWNTFLFGGEELNILEIFLRATILYFTIFTMTRILGHRQVGIVSAFNFIIHAGMAHVATSRMVNPESSLVAAIIIIIVSYSLALLLSWFDYKFPDFVGNSPIHLVENGIILRKNLRKAHITLDDLLSQLRINNVNNLSEISEVILEPMGEISVLKKSEVSPVTRGQLKLPPTSIGIPIPLIYDGKIERNHLHALGLNEDWLLQEIKKKGFSIPDVMLATLESSGNIHVSVM